MAVLSARLNVLRLNAGRLNFIAPIVPTNPNPPHLSQAGPLALQWTAAPGTFDVYFGTDPNPPLVGTTTSPAWLLAPLDDDTVYYWKIVARNSLGTAEGPVWSFTAALPRPATTPSPAHGATNVPQPVTLSWVEPQPLPGMTYDVYFGPTPSGLRVVSANQSETRYTPPGPLHDGATYYWRIVSRNGAGTTTTTVWHFEVRDSTRLFITIGGEDVHARTRIAGLTVRDILTDTPNTARFTIEGAAPALAKEVRIGLGSLGVDDIIFGGYIDTVEAIYEGVPENRAWAVTCQDYVYGLNRKKVRIRYGQQSASYIARDLLTKYAPTGYTWTHVPDGLPVVDGGIDFTEEDLTACFARLAQRIGGYWYVDYAKDVHLFLEENFEAPDPLKRGSRTFLDDPPITAHHDVTQLRTRVYVEGGGSEARGSIAVGATSLPVTDASWYSASGGLVVSGPQRIAYSGKGIVGGPAAPAATPQSVPGNLGAGPYSYVVTTITSGAESPMSAASAPVSLPPVSSPGVAPDITPVRTAVLPAAAASVVGVSTQVVPPAAGPVLTPFTTGVPAPGGFVASPWGTGVPAPTTGLVMTPNYGGIPNPTQPPSLVLGEEVAPPGVWAGSWWYAYNYVRHGFTLIGPEANYEFQGSGSYAMYVTCPASPHSDVTRTEIYRRRTGEQFYFVGGINSNGGTFRDGGGVYGPQPPKANDTGVAGLLTPNAVYHWKVKFLTATGESAPGVDSAINIGPANGVRLDNVPTSPDGRVTKRRIYRTKANGTTFYYEGEIADNITTFFNSGLADTAISVVMSDLDSTGSGLLVRNASYWFLVAFVTANGESLNSPGINAVTSNVADSVYLSSIPVSTDPRVTARRVYRTAAGGSTYLLDGTINDNVTTVYGSQKADNQLGAAFSFVDTSGDGKLTRNANYWWLVTFLTATGESLNSPGPVSSVGGNNDSMWLSSIPTSPDSRVIGRRVYRTKANNSSGNYHLEATINDNTTTTLHSYKADSALGAGYTWVDTTRTGKLSQGSYWWTVTFVTAQGETEAWQGVNLQATLDSAQLTNVPTSPDGRVTARKIYRTTVNGDGSTYKLEATISDNTTTTYLSQKGDGQLGAAVPWVNTTGTGKLQSGANYWWTVRFVTASGESSVGPGATVLMPAGYDTAQLTIPVSPDGRVTSRKVYRNVANGGTYFLEATISGNVVTTFTSSKADSALGEQLVDGNTTTAGGQILVTAIALGGAGTTARKLYRTESGGSSYKLVTTLADNITTSYQDNKGDGSLGSTASGEEVVELTGIPASGAGSILYEIRQGSEVNVLVQCDDATAQAALAALEGPPSAGIIEHFLQDRRLSMNTALATGTADLKLFAYPLLTVNYASRDPKTRSGKTITIDLPELDLVGEYTIQTVDITEIGIAPGLFPRYKVQASSVRWSLEDVIRRLQLETPGS